jgi:hypothetical protein
MKSLRSSAQTAGVTDSPLSVRSAGQRVGMNPPFSVAQLVNRWEHPPLEEAKFHQDIVTGGLSGLRGFVDLTLRNDGTYKIHFHLHDSGTVDYKFQARAAFAAANGLTFAWQNSGKVEGTESTTLTHAPMRDRDTEFAGSHPLIKQHWAAVKAGKMGVTKEYSAAGVAGFIQDVVKSVVGVASDAARGAAGVVIGLGDEMVNAINSLGVNADLGIIAGAVVFATGGGLVLATVSGVQFGAVTAALIHSRQVRPDEYGFAAKVFGGSLPPIENLWLTNLESFGGRAITLPGPRGKIYLNVGAYCMDHPTTHVQKNYPVPGQLFIHELAHSWQIHHRSFVPGWICEGAVLQAGNSLGISAYKYGPAGQPWGEFNIEQQASIVDDWFGGTRKGSAGPMSTNDDFYRYIRDNIQQGRT